MAAGTITRFIHAGAVLLLVTGATACGRSDVYGSPLGGDLMVLASHDAFPTGIRSYRVTMARSGVANGCGTALTQFTSCNGATQTSPVSGLCAGSWMLDPQYTALYPTIDCTGAQLNASPSQTPDPLQLAYATPTSVVLKFQGYSSLEADVTFATSAIIPSGTNSVEIRARRTPHPDVANCGAAVTDVVATCYSYTSGTDFPAQYLSSSACGGSWTVCVRGASNTTCGGNTTLRGTSSAVSLEFGKVTSVTVNTTSSGAACPF